MTSGHVDPPRTVRQDVLADAQLVRQCLGGQQQAWEQLYFQCHPRLCEALHYMLRRIGQPEELTEEIAARVWFALLRDSGRLLAKFDAERDCRIGVFLVGLARNEVMLYVRTERRRLQRERVSSSVRNPASTCTEYELEQLMREFAATLTPREREFLDNFLLSSHERPEPEDGQPEPAQPEEISAANMWQRRHRLREKLKSFFGET